MKNRNLRTGGWLKIGLRAPVGQSEAIICSPQNLKGEEQAFRAVEKEALEKLDTLQRKNKFVESFFVARLKRRLRKTLYR